MHPCGLGNHTANGHFGYFFYCCSVSAMAMWYLPLHPHDHLLQDDLW
jgi:hypothetical protein